MIMSEIQTKDAEGGTAPVDDKKDAFKDPALEKLFQSYCLEQKRSSLQCFMAAVILLDVYAIVAGRWWLAWVVGILVAILGIVILIIGRTRGGRLLAVFGWLLGAGHVALHVAITENARSCIAWPILIVYLGFVALPLRLHHCLILWLGTTLLHGLSLQIFETDREDLLAQHLSNITFLICAGLIGLLGFLLEDTQQREAFLEASQSLEVKLVIEEQSAEQERLLLSVLPEHVAVKMRQDLGLTDTQFKKIYMSRHENVSILYADIVGFTAISSTYSAQDLVAILNELFARFDKLAEKYKQLRIKILGDCYYCISGAPVERPDHAVLSIHMGLSMVKSIKYLQQTTNSPVDMRVGIHTGAVLAGVLGQRQWQFDVYSRDVELANKMESSGMAGRVHISEKTLSYLDGEFEVEPAFGEKREEALRLAGIKTYFICKVLKPFQSNTKSTDAGSDSATIFPDNPSDSKDEGDSVKSPMEDDKGLPEGRERENSDDFKNRLRNELVGRDGLNDLSKHTGFFLGFLTPSMEQQYRRTGGVGPGPPMTAAALLPIAMLIATYLVPPYPSFRAALLGIPAALLMLLEAIPFLAVYFKNCGILSSIGKKMSATLATRLAGAIAIILLFSFNNVAQMELCNHYDDALNVTETLNELYSDTTLPPIIPLSCSAAIWCTIRGCAAGALGALVGALMPLPLIARALLATLAAAPPAALSVTLLSPSLDCRDNYTNFNNEEMFIVPTKYSLCVLMTAIILALIVLSKYMEQTSRVLFLWKTQIDEQKEKAADMRRRNEALVYNVLPPHVAVHFMGQRRRQHNDLYSQSYAEVGVLFASMPNFAEFYSEETVNNQGLECLRFLNEVISDFDALLDLPKFQDIIKIKTIGSSYMAAAGLNSSRIVKSDDPITVRWQHLSLLVEFALELKKALQSINEQSFNHFVLKMGINHGPITAGVIGARKPHYDIWGNTVNVASRMESTGKAGCIQVTEETCHILQNFGYKFEQRGLVSVKGKGQLMTYYLLGKDDRPATVSNASPSNGNVPESKEDSSKKNIPDQQKNNVTPKPYSTVRSPNGSLKADCNGDVGDRMSKGDGDDIRVKLLEEDTTCSDVNMDAGESDALLKH